jgi:hypothetical protein
MGNEDAVHAFIEPATLFQLHFFAEEAVVGHVVSGVEPAKAAELAGYANGRNAASDLLRKPAVAAAIQYETT